SSPRAPSRPTSSASRGCCESPGAGDAALVVERKETEAMTFASDRKPRILIVEDHPIIAELVETRLRIEGMDPIKCPGGREALQVLAAESLDAVILDIMMPDVDGYEVLRQIRTTPATGTLPVIFLTAKATPGDIEKGLAMGANYYITKPFSGLDLVRKVRLCLEEKKAAAAQAPGAP